jgi:cell division protein FtsZ
MIEVNNKISNIRIVGSGESGKRIVEKIRQDQIEGEEMFLIDSGRVVSETGAVDIGDVLAGADILICIFDPEEKNDYLAAIVALASKMGILVFGMTTTPAGYAIKENDIYSNMINYGIDSLFIFSNEEDDPSERITDSIQAMVSVLNVAMTINLELNDYRVLFKNKGIARIGFGYGQGDDIGLNAAEIAYKNCGDWPDMHDATTALLLISGDITLTDAGDASEYVRNHIAEGADIIFSATYDESREYACRVIVIATGFNGTQTGSTV